MTGRKKPGADELPGLPQEAEAMRAHRSTSDHVPEGGFVKLYGERLLRSSLMETHVATRWCFMVMLAGADMEGRFRCATAAALARAANVSLKDAKRAIEELEAPDPDSTSPESEGRRILRIAGGWQIVTHQKYRDYRSRRQVQDAERQKRQRKRDASRPSRDTSRASRREAEAEADPEADLSSQGASSSQGSSAPKPARESRRRLAPSLPESDGISWHDQKQLLDVSPEFLEARCAELAPFPKALVHERLLNLGLWLRAHPESRPNGKKGRKTLSRWVQEKLIEDADAWKAANGVTP